MRTTIVNSYTHFEKRLLVAAYYVSNRLAKDSVYISEIKEHFSFEIPERFTKIALSDFFERDLSADRIVSGDLDAQSIWLTAAGIREAESIISRSEVDVLAFDLKKDQVDASDRLPDAASQQIVPAADRIVTLNHNEINELGQSISVLVNEVEKDNGSPDEFGLRERLLGQLKAGRELLMAGQFRAYLLYEVLIRALNELIEKYGNETIKGLANALLGAVVSKLFEGP